MASEEQLALSNMIKAVHQSLRDLSKCSDPSQVWEQHVRNQKELDRYATAMFKLATSHWDKTMETTNKKENCRIQWVMNACRNYFFTRNLAIYRDKDERVMKEMNENYVCSEEPYPIEKIKLLDVGSCYNPFADFPEADVTAIDIAPATDTVMYCDFLTIPLKETPPFHSNNRVEGLPPMYFDAVVFSLMLEYIPTSGQRMHCCQKAYDVLKPEGLLLIVTPDSCHQGANAKLMKNWRYSLGLLGFARVKIEKLQHITCMAFRKCLVKEVSQQWCAANQEDYMEPALYIPQDFNTNPIVLESVGQQRERTTEEDNDISEMFAAMPCSDVEMS
ncbi:S-adenosylmethionine sensor upstream of mTORC1 [Toxorhynchites rutilus septentrionalis]|uniref:S-adenosylmethionine sensor upstream of mTORC1 n=1 Tax=Toxorhynchites rutilus septentrionalis TaxID=329112 RepID=UPI0024799DF2|nr:S-adenosylmethionine sensor upstream of mTORC1 [Toxorhynchites rutilus septentrionalis]XP_055639290.1 S-adenosylmethionine sensor upstream of mTORC1 [Toxorhynchites rutilus septentrionalis]